MDLKNLSQDQLIELVHATEKRFAASNANAAELIIELEATHQKLQATFEELLQAGKMATMGKIISDVCHDIANPIAIVMGYLDILDQSKNIPPFEHSIISKAIVGCKRSQKILTHLRNFVRKNPESMTRYCDLKVICEQAIDFFKALLANHQIQIDLVTSESMFTEIDETHMEPILQNLIVNSRDAFMERKSKTDQYIKIFLTKVDQTYGLITFEDNAGGISSQHLGKIFTDFFTTKSPGKGTGLGLSLIKRLVESFGGSIQLENMENVGVRFLIKVPLKEKANLKSTENRSMKSEGFLLNKQHKLLLVDDEQDLLDIMRYQLTKYFQIDSFSDPIKALEALSLNRYDIIITDMAMPGCSGLDILNRSSIINRDAFKVVISGHVASLNQDLEEVSQKSDLVFYKPIPSIESFLDKIVDEMLKKLDSVSKMVGT